MINARRDCSKVCNVFRALAARRDVPTAWHPGLTHHMHPGRDTDNDWPVPLAAVPSVAVKVTVLLASGGLQTSELPTSVSVTEKLPEASTRVV